MAHSNEEVKINEARTFGTFENNTNPKMNYVQCQNDLKI